MSTMKFTEYEATWRVDPDKLPEDIVAIKPHIFVQGYRVFHSADNPEADREDSWRYSGSSHQAFHRRKSITYSGARKKETTKINVIQCEKTLEKCPTVAVKFRRLWMDEHGRQWAIDYFPLIDTWVAESEFKNQKEMDAYRQDPEKFPAFITDDITDSPDGYTRTRARKLSHAELDQWIDVSNSAGERSSYDPDAHSVRNMTGTR